MRTLAFFGQLQPRLPARLGLTVERLRDRRGSAHLAEQQHLQLKIAAVVFHPQHVACVYLARSLSCLSVGLDPAQFTCPLRQRACLEEPGGPQPLVHSHAAHNLF